MYVQARTGAKKPTGKYVKGGPFYPQKHTFLFKDYVILYYVISSKKSVNSVMSI